MSSSSQGHRLVTLNERVAGAGVTCLTAFVVGPTTPTAEVLEHWRGAGVKNPDGSYTFSRGVTVELRSERPIAERTVEDLREAGLAVF